MGLLCSALLHPMYMIFDSIAIAANGAIQIAGFGLGATTVSIFAFAIGGQFNGGTRTLMAQAFG